MIPALEEARAELAKEEAKKVVVLGEGNGRPEESSQSQRPDLR